MHRGAARSEFARELIIHYSNESLGGQGSRGSTRCLPLRVDRLHHPAKHGPRGIPQQVQLYHLRRFKVDMFYSESYGSEIVDLRAI
eukprot:3532423-Prymnesium_polylepis.1